jgi:ferritin-like metal-binding protein YciE
MPATPGDVSRLEQAVVDLERRITRLEDSIEKLVESGNKLANEMSAINGGIRVAHIIGAAVSASIGYLAAHFLPALGLGK